MVPHGNKFPVARREAVSHWCCEAPPVVLLGKGPRVVILVQVALVCAVDQDDSALRTCQGKESSGANVLEQGNGKGWGRLLVPNSHWPEELGVALK